MCYCRNIKSGIIINFDAANRVFFGWFHVNLITFEFATAVNVFISEHGVLNTGNTKQLVQAWLITACSPLLNCNRFPPNVRKRKGPVPFDVPQMRVEGKGLYYCSYVTECEDWQGGARGLIGVNTCGVQREQHLRGKDQSMRVKRLWGKAVRFTYGDGFWGGEEFL